jgi:hypothetical protein
MDSSRSDEDPNADAADALRALVTDLEDLVDWAEEAAQHDPARKTRAVRGRLWVALGIVGLLSGLVAYAAFRRRRAC